MQVNKHVSCNVNHMLYIKSFTAYHIVSGGGARQVHEVGCTSIFWDLFAMVQDGR